MTDYHTKYRPLTLDTVCGQDHIAKPLETIITNRSSHSFLLVGPSGVGKTTIARIVAARLDCVGQGLLEIDAASNSGVDSMREIASSSGYRPMGSNCKAIIIDECHTLSKQAWQSVLKVVEEPPEWCYWFFCTTESGKVPNTIKTRSTVLELRPVRTDDIFDRLVCVVEAEELATPDPVLDVIAQFADGSMRSALVGLATCQAITDPKEAADALRFSSANDETIDFIRYVASGRDITWKECMTRLNKLGEVDAESLRIGIVNYLAVVIRNSEDEQRVCSLLQLLSEFSASYDRSTAKAGLMLSLGRILFTGDRQ